MFHLLLAVIYLAFMSLGLPDALLGSAWPSMYPVFHVPVSYAGIISMIIAAGTVISSLQNDRLTKKLGTGKITAISVATTAVALMDSLSAIHLLHCVCGQFLTDLAVEVLMQHSIILVGFITKAGISAGCTVCGVSVPLLDLILWDMLYLISRGGLWDTATFPFSRLDLLLF